MSDSPKKKLKKRSSSSNPNEIKPAQEIAIEAQKQSKPSSNGNTSANSSASTRARGASKTKLIVGEDLPVDDKKTNGINKNSLPVMQQTKMPPSPKAVTSKPALKPDPPQQQQMQQEQQHIQQKMSFRNIKNEMEESIEQYSKEEQQIQKPMLKSKKSVSKSQQKVSFPEPSNSTMLKYANNPKKPYVNYELLMKFDPQLLRKQEEFLNMSQDEKRKQYIDPAYVEIAKLTRWADMPYDPNDTEKMIIVHEENFASKKAMSKPEIIKIPEPKSMYPANDHFNNLIAYTNASITTIEADVIVAHTDKNLNLTDFATTIVYAGGKEMESELGYLRKAKIDMKLNHSTVTVFGYKLPAYYVVFAVFPIGQNEETLKQCYMKVLDAAVAIRQRTIAIPCMATGGYGFPRNKACAVALSSVRTWLETDKNASKVNMIIFSVFQKADLLLYQKSIPLYFPRSEKRAEDLVLRNDDPDSRAYNYISLDCFDNKLTMLNNSPKFSFKGNHRLTDCILWKISALTLSTVDKRLTELDCTACIHLTDGAVYCLESSFPNLEKMFFDGCDKITELSVIIVTEKLTRLKFASFRACGVKILPVSLLNDKKFDFSSCPVVWLKAQLEDKVKSVRKYKVIIVRDNATNLVIDADGKSKTLLSYLSTENMNVIECDHKIASVFATAGSIFVAISNNPSVIESTMNLAASTGCGSPIVICSTDRSIALKAKEAIKNSLVTKKADFDSDMNFVQQQLYGKLKLLDYFLSRADIVSEASIANLKDFKSTSYINAMSVVDKYFAEQQTMKSTNLQQTFSQIKSKPCGLVTSEDDKAKMHLLSLQGEIVTSEVENCVCYCTVELLAKCINGLAKFKNKDANGKLIPWLPEVANSFYIFQETQVFQKLKLSEIEMNIVQKILLRNSLAIKVVRPWINDIVEFPASFLPALLPSQPPVPLKSLWPDFCSPQDQEIETAYFFSLDLPAQFMQKLLSLSCRFTQVVTMWDVGAILHYGCTEILLLFDHKEKSVRLAVRTMNIKEAASEKETAKKTTKKKSSKKKETATAKVEDSKTDESKSKDSREEKPKPATDENAPSTLNNPVEENLQYVLTSTFQLFRQFVLASSLSLKLYIDEYIKCPACASKTKWHYLPVPAYGDLPCDDNKTTFEYSTFGLDSLYIENLCAHPLMIACATTAFKRCVRCGERFENMPDEMWCCPATDSEDNNACYTCTQCLRLLAEQNALLNDVTSMDATITYSNFTNNGVLYEMETAPFVIIKDFVDDDFLPTHLVPLDVQGILLEVLEERLKLIDFCPNNETVHIVRCITETGLARYRIFSSVKTFFVDTTDFSLKILFVEKPASLIIRSFQRLDPCISVLTTGMYLEVARPEDTANLYLGLLEGFKENGHLNISFQSDKNDTITTSILDDNLHPARYGITASKSLIVSDIKSKNSDDYDEAEVEEETSKKVWASKQDNFYQYGAHLELWSGTVVPAEFFSKSQTGGVVINAFNSTSGTTFSLKKKILTTDFEEGMILEARDKRFPNKKNNFIAEIKEVNETSITVFYNGYQGSESTTLVFNKDDPDIHPVGYSKYMNEKLLLPTDFEDTDPPFSYFCYLDFYSSRILPVPHCCFTKEQTGGCPTHLVESMYDCVPDDEDTSLYLCTNNMTMHKILCYASVNMLDIRKFIFNGTVYCYLPLPSEIVSDQCLRYPQLQLVHKFDKVESHRLFTVVLQTSATDHQVRKFIKDDDNDSEQRCSDCNLISNEVALVTELMSNKNKDNRSLFTEFYSNYYFEIIHFMAAVNRIKLNITDQEFRANFSALKSLTVREVAEGIQRYSWLSMCTLMTVFSTSEKPAYKDSELKVLNEALMQVFTSKIDPEAALNVLNRTVQLGTSDTDRKLAAYKIPNNTVVTSINNFWFPQFKSQSAAALLSVVHQFRSLTVLILNQSGLKTFDIDSTFLSLSLTCLVLDENPLKIVPPCVFRLKELRALSMVCCGISKLPDDFDKLLKLAVLLLDANSIDIVPKSLSKLKLFQHFFSLNAVRIYSPNSVIRLEEFGKMARKLYFPSLENKTDEEIEAIVADKCSYQSFSSVPIEKTEDIKRLNSLITSECRRFESALSTNNMKLGHGFPTEMFALKFISFVNLSFQHISEVPPEINQMINLKELNVSGCPYLENISEQIVAIDCFEKLHLTGCTALKNPSPEIVKRGMDSILGYFRRCLAGSEDCHRTKLMMVGLGGAGKTKFVEALLNDDLKASDEESPEVTDGITIDSFVRKVDEETTLNFATWDFAGQSVYYNTHQFFLSNRAIYFLLWNSRLGYENSGLDFWLSSIACHAPKAPIFVIATHADIINRIELPETELKAAYPKIAHFAHVSSITGQGMQELVDKMVEVALAQPYMNQKMPTIFLRLEDIIYEERYDDCDEPKMIMSLSDVEKLAFPLGLVTPQEVKEALNFLHELGSVQYFSNDILREFVIINPQWLVNAMACLISVKEAVIKDGRFVRADISKIWSKYATSLHQWLLKLTEEFDLTFALPSEEVNIVPCMLPDLEPQIDMMVVDNVNVFEMKMVYKFEYLPAGLFNRTQSRLCQYSEGSNIWKRGSLLNKNNHLALIKQTRDKELHVTVQGSRPENVLYLIHEVIENLIHDFFQGVNYDIMIPCPDCIKNNSQDVHMFSSKHVKRASELKAPFLQCSQLFHIVSLGALRATLPPSTMGDYEQQLLRMVQDLNDLRTNVSTDICLLCCNDNINQSNQVCPTQIEEAFKRNKITCNMINIKNDEEVNYDEFGMKVMNACLILVCVSPEFCSSKRCTDMFSYIRQSNKQMMYAILGCSDEWKKSSLGLQIANELYFDFQKGPSKFEPKFQEMLTRIKARITRNAQPVRHPPVFFSYCWINSMDATKRGHKRIDSAIGEVDPRDLAKDLRGHDVDLWIDYLQLSETQGALFEDIADALRHSELFVACVSDEYISSQNCLREYRFASAMQLPKIICVVGKGDNWQKSEINLLALDASIYNFQIRSKDATGNLLKKINELLKRKMPERQLTMLNKNGKPTKKDETAAQLVDMSAYRELGELAQRKILQQANYMATKLRSTDASMGKPYPRIFFIDIQHKIQAVETDDSKVSNSNDEKQPKADAGRPKSSARVGSALTKQSKGLYSDIQLGDMCIKWLCEYEGGWHTTGEPLSLQSFEESYAETFADFLDKISPFQSQMLSLLQHSSVTVDLLLLKNGNEIFTDLKRRASAFNEDGFEISYRFLYRLVRQVDAKAKRGGMQRCYLYSKKIVWLCPEHQKFARGFLADDDLDSEDVTINVEMMNDEQMTSAPLQLSDAVEQAATPPVSVVEGLETNVKVEGSLENAINEIPLPQNETEGINQDQPTIPTITHSAESKIRRKIRSRMCCVM